MHLPQPPAVIAENKQPHGPPHCLYTPLYTAKNNGFFCSAAQGSAANLRSPLPPCTFGFFPVQRHGGPQSGELCKSTFGTPEAHRCKTAWLAGCGQPRPASQQRCAPQPLTNSRCSVSFGQRLSQGRPSVFFTALGPNKGIQLVQLYDLSTTSQAAMAPSGSVSGSLACKAA